MQGDDLTLFIGLVFLFGFILAIMMIAYEDGVSFALPKKILCRLGYHKLKTKIGKLRINVYYCRHCKKPRKYPELKVVDGGKKLGNNKFRF